MSETRQNPSTKCPECNGRGTLTTTCQVCDGEGRVLDPMPGGSGMYPALVPCEVCQETGKVEVRCEKCQGRGSL
jgi:DnaJ-class molecular chaperone